MSIYAQWQPWVGVAVGVFSVVLGLLFRAGRLRKGATWYGDSTAPPYLRNLPLALIPGGLMMLVWIAAVVVFDLNLVSIGWMLMMVGCLLFAAFALVLYKPPRWLKPGWMQAEEQRRAERPRRSQLVWFVADRLVLLVTLTFALAMAVLCGFLALRA